MNLCKPDSGEILYKEIDTCRGKEFRKNKKMLQCERQIIFQDWIRRESTGSGNGRTKNKRAGKRTNLLEQEGLIEKNGFFASTGGRKANAIQIVSDFKISIGIGILISSPPGCVLLP